MTISMTRMRCPAMHALPPQIPGVLAMRSVMTAAIFPKPFTGHSNTANLMNAAKHAVEYKPAPNVTPQELIRVRKSLRISRALFAAYLRTNVRTLENWEQG